MKEIIPGVYIENRYSSGNVGFIVTGAGVVAVDVPMRPDDARHWLDQIHQFTDEPLIALVQTDFDRERVVSTSLVDAPLIAHENAWDAMRREYGQGKLAAQIAGQLGGWTVRLPDITFTERMILNKGRREICIMHAGGHSPASAMVYLPQERLIMAGNVVYKDRHPQMEYTQSRTWLAVLTWLRKMDVDLLVPGYGPVCDLEATYPLSDYIRSMRLLVRNNFRAGRSKSETSRLVISELMSAFPYDRAEQDHIRVLVKGGSDRIYDEYRTRKRTRMRVIERQYAA